ncbi:MBL fold metallo-hydrolase RNA specificity domain-containing protein [Butyrivibrio sp. MC2013]|uniref:MBL fold metallo-hydrolase RNA specificity domain-containing protein n=1 Tax=Butyrivibrio sp. MC2013 TaxID=1280686 RepID=UPI00047949A0|nr:MBL fold metallo-hydrolase [Butyrivibrio sp. MC2013]
MKLTFIGADHEVTGSCHCLQAAGKTILIDYGMEQGRNIFENAPLPVAPALIDYVLLTHAHVDHSGMLPELYAKGFRGEIYATEATCDLCEIMLRDCAHIQMQEADWYKRKRRRSSSVSQVEPLYVMEDAEGALGRFEPCDYGKIYDICDGISIRFTDIGHLLGSASIEVWITEKGQKRKIVFSGDIGNTRQPLIRDPQLTDSADYVVMESTYGDRLHSTERPDYVRALTEVLDRTFARGGNVVIPSFAVGRTQEMLYFLRQIKAQHLVTAVDDFEVYVDSPMAVSTTDIFADHEYACYDEEALDFVRNGINPITFPGLRLSITQEESVAINFDEAPKVIISASGMCEAGRIRHHLKHNLWREDSTILFVGYQAVGTLGRAIIEGATSVKLFGEEIDVKAEIAKIEGLSGHADRDGLMNWLKGFTRQKPRKIFIVHGEDSVTSSFAAYVHEELGYDTYAPYSGTEFDLVSGQFIKEGVPVMVQKKTADVVSDVYQRLINAGNRLVAVIQKVSGLSNKDKAKFADQINSLCDKYDR